MNVNDVKEMAKEAGERNLCLRVLRAIRDNECAEPRECAREALEHIEAQPQEQTPAHRIRVETLERAQQLAHYAKVSTGVPFTVRESSPGEFELTTRIGDETRGLSMRGGVDSRTFEQFVSDVGHEVEKAKRPPEPPAAQPEQQPEQQPAAGAQ